MKTNRRTQITFILLICIGLSGCISRNVLVKERFWVEVQRPEAAVEQTSQRALAVQPFSIAPAFQGCGLVSRTGENQYESDYYNEYFVLPAQMITEQTRNWLSASGLFAQVLSPLSSVRPSHVLEGHISRMFFDVTDSTQPRAVLEITCMLVKTDNRSRDIQFQNTYTSIKAAKSPAPQDFIAAQSAGLREILESLEQDLAARL